MLALSMHLFHMRPALSGGTMLAPNYLRFVFHSLPQACAKKWKGRQRGILQGTAF